MNKQSLTRREFSGLCAALGSSLPAISAMIAALSSASALAAAARTVKFRDGIIVPALGQGSWHLAQGRHPAAAEEARHSPTSNAYMVRMPWTPLRAGGAGYGSVQAALTFRKPNAKRKPNDQTDFRLSQFSSALLGRR